MASMAKYWAAGLDPGVGVGLGYLGLPHEAPAAVQLETVGGHLVLQVSGPVLGHARHLPVQPAARVELEALVDEGPAHHYGGLQLGELVLHRLQVRHPPPPSSRP